MFDDDDYRVCQECQKEFKRSEMSFSLDCHGIPFRLLCDSCWRQAMAKGYDGEYYDCFDENIDYED